MRKEIILLWLVLLGFGLQVLPAPVGPAGGVVITPGGGGGSSPGGTATNVYASVSGSGVKVRTNGLVLTLDLSTGATNWVTGLVNNGAFIANNSGVGTNTTLYGVTTITGSLFSNAFTRYVDPNGNNSTAIQGDDKHPWKDLDVAVSGLTASNFVILSAGRHIVSNICHVPYAGGIIGKGMGATEIVSWFVTNNIPCPVIVPGTNSTIAGFTLRLSAPTNYQSGIGTHTSYARAFTNALISDVEITDGQTDGWYVRHTNNCTATIVNSRLSSHWDVMAHFSGNHKFTLKNCELKAWGPNFFNSAANCLAVDTTTGDGTDLVTFMDCTLISSNQSSAVFSFNGPLYPNVVLVNCLVTNYGSDNTLGPANLRLQNTFINPLLISTDVGGATLTYTPVITTRIVGGGDFDDGSGPVQSVAGTRWNSSYLGDFTGNGSGLTNLPLSGLQPSQYYSTAASAVNWTSNNLYQGKVKLAAGSQNYLVTNSIVTTTSWAMASLNTIDTTAIYVRAFIPSNGVLMLSCPTTATADTIISWEVRP
jgi:hypothetical protein